MAFGAGDDRLASTGNDLIVKIWDLTREEGPPQEALVLGIVNRRANGLAFSPNGHRLAVGSADGFVQILDGTPLRGLGDAGQLLNLEGHQHAVVALAYSPDGARIASASWDETARVWDARTGRETATFRGHSAAVTGVAWTRDGRHVASASRDGTVRVWDQATGAEVLTLDAQAGTVYGLAFNRDGTALATAHYDGSARVWDATTGRATVTIARAHNLPVLGVAFSPDGAHLASAGGGDNVVKVWDWQADTKQPLHTLRAPENIIRNPAYSPDGRQLAAVVATPARVWTWDMTTGEGNVRPLPNSWNAAQAVFTPGGRLAVVSGGRIEFLELGPLEAPALVGCHAGEIACAAFSPDGRRMATGAGFNGRGEIRIWETSRLEKSR
jgi:WD40 repeat protein